MRIAEPISSFIATSRIRGVATLNLSYDALLLLSFGGPERREDVIPFLENVLRGKNVPRERMLEVAEHYYHFDGKSPINDHNRQLLAALRIDFDSTGVRLPLYWGNRNWHPLLADTLRQMQADGVRRALALATSAFSSYSGCRQYLDDIARARAELGPAAPHVDKLRTFGNHPGFIEAQASQVVDALESLTVERQAGAQLVFTAHSVPVSMARQSKYVEQLEDACSLVAEFLGRDRGAWDLVYQSRSGPPSQPWLEPDVGDYLRTRHSQGRRQAVVIVPIGFLSDHMEVLYDLDTEAAALCAELGIDMVRSGTVGTHPRFVRTIRELVEERLSPDAPRRWLGTLGLPPDECPDDCCPRPVRPVSPS